MSEQNPEHPIYHIEKVSDFLQVPEDRVEACLEDFKRFIQFSREAETLLNSLGKEVLKQKEFDVEEVVFVCNRFSWIDDGEHNVTLKVILGSDKEEGDRHAE